MSRLRKEKRDRVLAEALALVHPRNRTREVIAGFVLDFIAAAVPAVLPVPVKWRWGLWLLSFGTLLCLLQIQIPPLSRIQLKWKIVGTLALICIFAGSLWSTAHAQWREEKASALEGDLIGAGGTHYPNLATPWVQIGDSETKFIMAPQTTVQPYFKPFPDAEFLVEGGGKGPLISTTIRDRLGNLVVEIKGSHWTVYPPYCSDKNYTKYAFEAKDSSGHVLLQIRLVPPMWIQVQGEWWNNEGKGLRILKSKDGTHGEVIPLGPQNQHNDELIQPIFKYPSKEHWGEF